MAELERALNIAPFHDANIIIDNSQNKEFNHYRHIKKSIINIQLIQK